MCKMPLLWCGPCEFINFFLPVMGVVMAKQLLTKLDQQFGLAGLGDIPPLITTSL